MRTILLSIASIASLLFPAAAQDPPEPPSIVARAGAPPVVDGRVGEEEWKDAAPFAIVRGTETFARGRLMRAGRQLYLALDSEVPAWALGVRFTFTDPVSRRANLVLVTPLQPPRPPLAAFRRPAGRAAEPLSCAACDVRFVLAGRPGFSFELRVPLDLLEFAATERPYEFSAEMWALDTDRALAVYPQDAQGVLATVRPAALRPEGTWEAEENEAPTPNPAIALLEEIGTGSESEPPAFFVHSGWRDGRRKDAPLAAFEERAARLVEAYPDYVSLHALLVQVRVARNDREGALAALDRLGASFPEMGESPRHLLVRMELLRDLGRYDEAIDLIASRQEHLRGDLGVMRELVILTGLRDAWRLEQGIREAEAARDDLPRVRLATSKGEIVIELFEDDAPNAVANFVALVEAGFYDGTRFHWAEGGSRVLGGDPNSRDDDPHNDGFGGPGYMIESEPGRRLHFPLTVGYADRKRTRRTEGSAFAIELAPFPVLDGVSTVFGRVIEGADTVRRLEYYDVLEKAEVLRKRPRPYVPIRR